MKRLILSFTLLSIFFVGCVTFPSKQLKKEEFVTLEGMSKKQIYNKSLQWLAINFNSAKSVLEYKDEKSGRIIGNITTSTVNMGYLLNFHSTMTIDIKDGRVRFTFLPHRITAMNTDRRIAKREINLAYESLNSIKPSFVKFMNNGSNNSNW